MLEFTTDENAGYLEITVDGKIEREAYEGIVAAIDRLAARHDRINAVEIIRSFSGMPPSLWWRDLNYSFSHLDKFGRCAVVTDHGWIGPVAKFFAAFIKVDIRIFTLAQLEAARAWARGEAEV